MMKVASRVLVMTVLGLVASSALADETPQSPAPAPSPAAAPEAAPEGESKFVVHGYLTQAYARGTDPQLVIGIPENGTTNYRRVALQFRYSPTSHDTLIVQFGQRKLGDSPIMQLEPEVKVDWAFYEHKFDSGTAVRVGRMAMPLGFYSEIRYVGTVLPFYRVPYNFYQEGSFTSETLDGIRVSQTINPASDWNAEIIAFGGGFDQVESLQAHVNKARAENAFGGQFWLNTPVPGLRFGVGGEHHDLRNSIVSSYADHSDKVTLWIAGVELVRERFRLRSEVSQLHYASIFYDLNSYYVYGGVNLTNKLTANLQYDNGKGVVSQGGQTQNYPNQYTDTTMGLNYAFHPWLVLKGEYHIVKARLFEDEAVSISQPAVPANYYIFSLSASF
jgi:hypothetical protein